MPAARQPLDTARNSLSLRACTAAQHFPLPTKGAGGDSRRYQPAGLAAPTLPKAAAAACTQPTTPSQHSMGSSLRRSKKTRAKVKVGVVKTKKNQKAKLPKEVTEQRSDVHKRLHQRCGLVGVAWRAMRRGVASGSPCHHGQDGLLPISGSTRHLILLAATLLACHALHKWSLKV